MNASSGITGKLERNEPLHSRHRSEARVLSKNVAHQRHDSQRRNRDGAATAGFFCNTYRIVATG